MPPSYRFGPYELHPASRCLLKDGDRVLLTPKALDILILLVESRDQVISRDELFERLWGGTAVEDNNLSQQISRIRRVLGPFGNRQPWIATIPGRGFQFVGPVTCDESPPLPPASAEPARMTAASSWPVMPDSIVGREDDLIRIHELLAEHAIVTLSGPGGVGKTRLAFELGQQQRASENGAYWTDLTRASKPDDVLPLIAESFGLADTGVRSLIVRVQEWLHERRPLLVFDNFEHVLAAASVLLELRARGTAASILVTSRAALSVRGEYDYPVAPLRWNPEPVRGDDPAADAPAVRLFFNRFHAHGNPVQHAASPHDVSALCGRVDGLPLAIELIAARASVISVPDLLKRDRILDILPEATRDAPARQQSMLRTLQWSYDLLPPPARTALRTLAVFSGGFTTEAGLGVLVAAQVAPDEIAALDLISILRQHSLLSFAGGAGSSIRMRMLETVREFALGQSPLNERARARAAHAGWFRWMFEREAPEIRSMRVVKSMDRLLAEQGNLRSALRWAAESGPPETLVGLATAASWFWHTANLFAEGREWTSLAIQVARTESAVSAEMSCRALAVSALMSFHLGLYQETTGLIDDVLSCPVDRFAATLAECLRGAILAYEDRFSEADSVIRHALSEALVLQDFWLQGLAALVAGHSASVAGDHRTAYDRLNGAPRGLGFLDAWLSLTLGLESIMLERLGEAVGCFRAALSQRYGSYVPIRQWAAALEGLGYVSDRHGQYETAILLLASADRWRRETAPLLKAWVPEHTRAMASVRKALGARFDDLWLEGQSMTLDEAVAIAQHVA